MRGLDMSGPLLLRCTVPGLL